MLSFVLENDSADSCFQAKSYLACSRFYVCLKEERERERKIQLSLDMQSDRSSLPRIFPLPWASVLLLFSLDLFTLHQIPREKKTKLYDQVFFRPERQIPVSDENWAKCGPGDRSLFVRRDLWGRNKNVLSGDGRTTRTYMQANADMFNENF